MSTSPSTDLVRVAAAVEKVQNGHMSFSELLREIEAPAPRLAVPVHVPSKVAISDAQNVALAKLYTVFGRVVPTSRRKLTVTERRGLLDEREVLDEIERMIDARKKDIRTTVYNHLDVEVEDGAAKNGTAIETVPRDKDGHYVRAAKAGADDRTREFSREVTSGSPEISQMLLEDLVRAGELSREDFEAMTQEIRVLDEGAIVRALREKPSLAQVLARATKPGVVKSALNIRNRKGV